MLFRVVKEYYGDGGLTVGWRVMLSVLLFRIIVCRLVFLLVSLVASEDVEIVRVGSATGEFVVEVGFVVVPPDRLRTGGDTLSDFDVAQPAVQLPCDRSRSDLVR